MSGLLIHIIHYYTYQQYRFQYLAGSPYSFILLIEYLKCKESNEVGCDIIHPFFVNNLLARVCNTVTLLYLKFFSWQIINADDNLIYAILLDL